MATLTRGELARASGVGIEALRYYEGRGLVPKPARTAANYRCYPQDTVQRVHFIKGAQALGFSLKEVAELPHLRPRPTKNCAPVLRRAEAKLESVEEKLQALTAVRAALLALVDECSGEGPMKNCTILEAMDQASRRGTGKGHERSEGLR